MKKLLYIILVLYAVIIGVGILFLLNNGKDAVPVKDGAVLAKEKRLMDLKAESDAYWNQLRSYYDDSPQEYMGAQFDMDRPIGELIKSYEEEFSNLCALFDLLRESDETIYQRFCDAMDEYDIDYSVLDRIPYYDNPLANPNWETHNLAVRNFRSSVNGRWTLVVLKLLEQQLFITPDDQELHRMVIDYRDKFKSCYESSYAD
ncbi:MAG: hypothetical protein E7115_08450 [Bacteroidales bacterium]|nr:hypothetical protein [Bacteroidales bacterium]